MNIVLKDFQEKAVDELSQRVRIARLGLAVGMQQAIVFSSPTGSGKTVIATRLLEVIAQGDGIAQGDPNATFLWVTDQPELNEQTRKKMLSMSTVFDSARLVTIEAETFDQERFGPGSVYFLNIQKLGKDSNLVQPGDKRTFTIWDTINNTAKAHPRSFFVIIDEAHRGMVESHREREVAQAIVQKFIKGSPDEIAPVGLIIGISATPQRFRALLEGTGRVHSPFDISPEDVRSSGLLKESITLFHPKSLQPADSSLLAEAARRLLRYTDEWKAFSETEALPQTIKPLLVVQVEDGHGDVVTSTPLDQSLDIIEQELGGRLTDKQVAHAFQEGQSITVGNRNLRYCKPSEIADDLDLKVVFFKMSLNTGWDCPRAEVMMSFRTAHDLTAIAQLVGRMVRNPLAKRVASREILNTVSLYLPHYDSQGVAGIVRYLTSADGGNFPQLGVRDGSDFLSLHRAEGTEACFEVTTGLITEAVERTRKMSNIRRAFKLVRLLNNHGVADGTGAKLRDRLVAVMRKEHRRAQATETFQKIVTDEGAIDLREVALDWDAAELSERVSRLELTDQGVNELFEWAGHRLTESLHADYRKYRVLKDGVSSRIAKLETFALSVDPEVATALEGAAGDQVDELIDKHRTDIGRLTPEKRDAYREIQRTAPTVSQVLWDIPDSIEANKGDTAFDKHVFVDVNGQFACTLNNWEAPVINREIARTDVVGWLRNYDRKPWAFQVSYSDGKAAKPLYPDFFVFRKSNGSIAADILDPHRPDLVDSWHKAKGLGDFAGRYGHLFGRIEIIVVADGMIRRVDVNTSKLGTIVRAMMTPERWTEILSSEASLEAL